VKAQRTGLDTLQEVQSLHELVTDLGALAAYSSQAEMVLPAGHPWVTKLQETRGDILTQVGIPAKRNATGFRAQTANRLADLRKEYVAVYLALHGKARLNGTEDKKRGNILRDGRLDRLAKLATIDLMPAAQLADVQNRLGGLKSCQMATEAELLVAPVCQHCGFKPASEPFSGPAGGQLTALDQRLDKLLGDWTKTLLENLQDPTTRESIALLPGKRKKLVESFVAAEELPDPLGQEFIQAVQEVLSGLAKVVLRMDDLKAALLDGGSPATPAEIKRRVDEFVAFLTEGKDANKVRIVLE
jgi:hypothetical protein